MTRFIIRLWLPNKPGALGRVASAIGSVGASLVGIDILEQGGGSAIDELIVEAVNSPNAAEKLIAALSFVEGVSVEDIRTTTTGVVDARLDALETAAELVAQKRRIALFDTLVHRARHDMIADWAVVLEGRATVAMVETGNAPKGIWLSAFLAGARSSDAVVAGQFGAQDIAHAEMVNARSALIVGREGRPFRLRERQQLDALGRIADSLASRLAESEAR